MMPTMKLRWLARKNAVTAEQIKAYSEKHAISMHDAKAALVNRQTPVLQQWFVANHSTDSGEWRDIEIVTEPSPLD